MQEASAIKAEFARAFGDGGRVHVIRAPGRVNLIGEHTDYNDGFVCPMAIEAEVRVVCRARQDGAVRLASTAFPGEIAEFSVEKKIEKGKPAWTNYIRGVAAELVGAGIPLTGMDALIDNTLPVGGGLSSSAAIEVGTGLAFLTLAGVEMDRDRLALICQKAEHEFAGVPVGIMDQMIVATGRQGFATQYDCRSGARQFVKINPDDLRVVIVNSLVKHELTGGEYAKRRKQCEEGVAYFQKLSPGAGIRALRDVTMKMIHEAQGKLEALILRRCRHVVSENQRTIEAATALAQDKYERAGKLMQESHASLRDDYEVSCAELDFLSVEAMTVKGVYGARMTGGGFGGCIVALTQPRSVEVLEAHLVRVYQVKFGRKPTAFATSATAGASVVE
ncbi:MAG: galactokinaselike [Phycisphaerales bacterium]|nr:galactokinaselike [Phycisphaerales bacterium]